MNAHPDKNGNIRLYWNRGSMPLFRTPGDPLPQAFAGRGDGTKRYKNSLKGRERAKNHPNNLRTRFIRHLNSIDPAA